MANRAPVTPFDLAPEPTDSQTKSKESEPAKAPFLTSTAISSNREQRETNGEPSEAVDPLLTVEEVALRLRVSKDWVWDHSSRKLPLLPVIRMGNGTLRYRAAKIEEFIREHERLSQLRCRRRA